MIDFKNIQLGNQVPTSMLIFMYVNSSLCFVSKTVFKEQIYSKYILKGTFDHIMQK